MQATAEANNLAAVASAKDQYYNNMEKVGMWHGIISLFLVSMKNFPLRILIHSASSMSDNVTLYTYIIYKSGPLDSSVLLKYIPTLV